MSPNCTKIGAHQCVWILWVIHAQNVHNHPVDNLCLAISLRMEGCGLREFGVQHWPETGPKSAKKPTIPIWDDRLWDPKVYPHSFKEEFSSGLCCDILLAGHHNGHLREPVDDHKNTVISMLSGRKAWHVIHGDGFPRSNRGRQRGIEVTTALVEVSFTFCAL